MDIAIYIIVNLLLFSSWYVFLFRNNENLSFVDRVLGVFVLGLAQIVITEMVLGIIFKNLFATPLFLLNLSISLIVLFVAFHKGEKGGFLAGIIKEARDKRIRFYNILRDDRVLLSVSVIFAIYFCYLLFIGYLFPSYSWDALLYHLPTVGFIVQSGTIEQIPYNSLIYTFINVFPKNIDLYFLWNVIFLKSDVIIDLSQLPFTIAGMLSIYGIGCKLGIKGKYSAYSSFLFFFAPVTILQSTTNYVDISVTALFLIALNFVLYRNYEDMFSENSNQTVLYSGNVQLLLAGITAGILLGSKGSGPLFVFVLSALYLINRLRTRHSLRRGNIPDDIKEQLTLKNIIAMYAVYFIVPVLLLGSYWYINNWVHYGNPVYPFIVKLFGKTIFNGTFSEFLHAGPDFMRELTPLNRLIYVWLERVDHYFYASDLSGFGPLWFILLLPCIIFSVIISLWKKRFDFIIFALMMVMTFLVYPYNWFTRYVVFFFGFGCLAFGVVLQFFQKRGKVLQYLALFIAVYTVLVINSQAVTPGKMKEFIHLPAKERSLTMLAPHMLNNSMKYNYGLWSWISNNVSAGDTLAYTFTPELIAPLWNSGFSNEIVFIKAGKFEDLLNKLEANSASYIVVLLKPRSMEYMWLSRLRELRNNPKWSAVSKRFKLEFNDGNHAVFRFFG